MIEAYKHTSIGGAQTMNVKRLLAEILNAVVSHERDKVKTQNPDVYLNQRKQLW